jgi:hypothetical protein
MVRHQALRGLVILTSDTFMWQVRLRLAAYMLYIIRPSKWCRITWQSHYRDLCSELTKTWSWDTPRTRFPDTGRNIMMPRHWSFPNLNCNVLFCTFISMFIHCCESRSVVRIQLMMGSRVRFLWCASCHKQIGILTYFASVSIYYLLLLLYHYYYYYIDSNIQSSTLSLDRKHSIILYQ